ncbi:glutamine amidotransferase [Kocuria soli]|uniref:Lipid II isoglutaminyl synthase (glutamine-hydrolyzing) subunit GatD n=1 Tax=Kocuria soli TaxID=2485125 RepID=A0A3N3ZWB8_9MICC|nr:glutamine amidotransferase [Kocuria soli]ROZ64696.1 glutamine amidotransferase [Kocuria soli]
MTTTTPTFPTAPEDGVPAVDAVEPGGRGEIHLVQLYPRDMNIYGDWGNTLTLKRRLEKRGYAVQLTDYNPGDSFPADADLFVGGGGQDSGQFRVMEDLQKIKPVMYELVADGVPMLAICGLYQLFGHEFRTIGGEVLPGIGIFDLTTVGGETRLIGNIVTESEKFGTIIGYENHSGLTRLADGQQPLGRVVSGDGNDGEDGTEGAVTNEVIGTYLHGSLLPKNPVLADHLIATAVRRRYSHETLEPLNDTLSQKAREVARNRPR